MLVKNFESVGGAYIKVLASNDCNFIRANFNTSAIGMLAGLTLNNMRAFDKSNSPGFWAWNRPHFFAIDKKASESFAGRHHVDISDSFRRTGMCRGAFILRFFSGCE